MNMHALRDQETITIMEGRGNGAGSSGTPGMQAGDTFTVSNAEAAPPPREPGLLALAGPALRLLLLLIVGCGLLYPLAATGVARVIFPDQAQGSLIERDGEVVGSRLIGQAFFGQEGYLWSRPSAAGDGYDASASSGSNLGPTNESLQTAVQERVALIEAAHPERASAGVPVPVDLVTASASGLDPHITPAAATYQVERIARERGLTPDAVQAIIDDHTDGRLLRVWGERVVNVLEVNLDLDAIAPQATGR